MVIVTVAVVAIVIILVLCLWKDRNSSKKLHKWDKKCQGAGRAGMLGSSWNRCYKDERSLLLKDSKVR